MTTINPRSPRPTTTTSTTIRTDRRARPVLRAGAVSGALAAAATTAVALAARAVDVPMKAAPRTEEVGRAIPLSGYAISTVMCTVAALVDINGDTSVEVVVTYRLGESVATTVIDLSEPTARNVLSASCPN